MTSRRMTAAAGISAAAVLIVLLVVPGVDTMSSSPITAYVKVLTAVALPFAAAVVSRAGRGGRT